MAAPVRERPAVAVAEQPPSNFEYNDDNEWDVGIGDLIIDLDADIAQSDGSGAGGGGGSATGGGGGGGGGGSGMASAAGSAPAKAAKLAVEHSATVDKGLKMKIKRTKPGTKTSEAKHEIVKSNELNGGDAPPGTTTAGAGAAAPDTPSKGGAGGKHGGGGAATATAGAAGPGPGIGPGPSPGPGPGPGPVPGPTTPVNVTTAATNSSGGSSKRGSSGHRRDKVKEKHGSDKTSSSKSQPSALAPSGTVVGAGVGPGVATNATPTSTSAPISTASTTAASPAPGAAAVLNNAVGSVPVVVKPDVNGVVVGSSRTGVTSTAASSAVTTTAPGGGASAAIPSPQPQAVRTPVYPAASGPGPPASPSAAAPQHPAVAPAPPASPASASAAPSSLPTTPSKADAGPVKAVALTIGNSHDDRPPPAKIKAVEPKEMADMCVGTSVGTITEPDCLGPCEPGTSVTLEGIVWHETEGGVLVVNVTWRGKTYVGTLLDCTRHDWAPPRFCDSPTSDLDARTPKGRGKRGRGAAGNTPGSDLSNFTETRSSVHSKLRNGGAKGRRGPAAQASSTSSNNSGSGSGSGSNSNSGSGSGNGSPMSFPTPRVESNKRKSSRTGDEDNSITAKKSKGAPPAATSPPPSPVLLECPEPNCCKKYKNINGLKYHQSRAHGSQDDEDTKDVASMSENDESNAEPPSPATKQDKVPTVEVKEEAAGADSADSVIAPSVSASPSVPESSSQTTTPVKGTASSPPPTAPTPGTPHQEPPSTPTPPTPTPPTPTLVSAPPPPGAPDKVVKPGVLRFGVVSEEGVSPVFVANKSVMPPSGVAVATLRALSVAVPPPGQGQGPTAVAPAPVQAAAVVSQPAVPLQPGVPPVVSFTFPLQMPQQPGTLPPPPPGHMAAGPLNQLNQMSPPAGPAGAPVSTGPSPTSGPGPGPGPAPPVAPGSQGAPGAPVPSGQQQQQHGVHVMHSLPANQGPTINKIPQFKVKPTSALMPDDKNKERAAKSASHKKKVRKSPAGSPHPNPQPDQPFGLESSGREDVQSPAYSDISDDAAPTTESEMSDKNKASSGDKKVEANQGPPHSLPSYFGIFPPYCSQSQPPYMVPPVQADGKPKDGGGVGGAGGVDKSDPKCANEKEKKDGPPAPAPAPAPVSVSVSGDYQQKLLQQHYYPYGYGYPYNLEPYVAVIPMDDKNKDDKSPGPAEHKALGPQPSPIQVPNPNKLKTEPGIAKHQNENHQILKESIEMKNQMSSFIFSRQQQVPQQVPQQCQPGPGPGQAPPSGLVSQTGPSAQQGQVGPSGPPCPPPGSQGLHGQHGQPPSQPCPPGHPGHPGPPGPQGPLNQMGQPQQLNQSPGNAMASQEEIRRYYLYADQRGLKTGPPGGPGGPPGSGPGQGPGGPPLGPAVPTSGLTTGPNPIGGPNAGAGPPGSGPGSGNVPGAGPGEPPLKATPPPVQSKQNQNLMSPSPKHKDKSIDEKAKEDKIKQEGVKPTMETQGPPPPPTSLFSYVHHPNYLQGPPYGGLPFDPAHPMYRPINSLLVPPGAYANNPYLHPQLHSVQRYHAPEDLSRPPAGAPKALDLLQHHANQYYSSHKIHELQERALKSPTPKTVSASASPSGMPMGPQGVGPPGGPGAPTGPPPPTSTAGGPAGAPPLGKPSPVEGKDSRSPPPQRHVHTHHHTHVGLGYPILAGQYSSPYGAAVLASQQAAAVAASGISPYTPK